MAETCNGASSSHWCHGDQHFRSCVTDRVVTTIVYLLRKENHTVSTKKSAVFCCSTKIFIKAKKRAHKEEKNTSFLEVEESFTFTHTKKRPP